MPKKTKRSISFYVPIDFVLPEFYEHATFDEVGEALSIGSALYTTVKSASTSREIQAIEEDKATQIAIIREQADQTIQTLEEALRQSETSIQSLRQERSKQFAQLELSYKDMEVNARKTEREQVKKQFEQTIHALEQDIESLQSKNKTYLERKLELESSRTKDIEQAEERTRISLKELLDEKDRSLKQAREDLEKTNQRNERAFTNLQDLILKQTEELRNLKDGITKRTSNAKSKGNEFEDGFRLKLIAAYGTSEHFSLEDTAKSGIGHAGDFIMRWSDHMILWETKNYDKPVPEEEIKKFKRDMKENAQATIGVMVSRYTPITGKTTKSDFYTEFVEGKMLIYISNFDRMSEEILPLLMVYFKLYWRCGQKLEEDDGKINIIRQIEKLHKKLEEKKKEWRVHKSHQENALRFTGELVEELEHEMKCLLNDLQGIVEKVHNIPEGIFRDCQGDESASQKIQVILSLTEPSSEHSVELNELADLYGQKRGNISRDTAKSHIKSVLLDSAFQQSKGKTPSRVLGLALKNVDDR